MLKNYLHVALRSIHKHKLYALINAGGLAIGLAACLLILQYVAFEWSYDKVPQADEIYRVENNYIRRGEVIYNSAATFSGVGPAMKAHFPEVVEYARLYHTSAGNTTVLTYDGSGEGRRFRERNVFFADPAFLDLFDVDVLRGNRATALSEANAVVLSASTARKYFGDEDPVGQTLRLNDTELNEHILTITGVFEDVPPNTHVHYDVLISYPTIYQRGSVEEYENDWGWYAFYTYVQLTPAADPRRIEAGTHALTERYKPSLKETNEQGERIRRYEFTLKPLREIHLYSHLQNEIEVNGNGTAVSFLFLVAGFILLIAWINYVNLATARSVTRAREVGVRKALGSTRGQLVRQFLFESALMNAVAVGVAVGLVNLVQPLFNRITERPLSFAVWDDAWIWGGLAVVFVAGALASGLYPAFVLSAFKPVTALKGRLHSSAHGAGLRKGLVVFQFVASMALITGTFAVVQQLRFMRSQDLGFDAEQTLIVEKPGVLASESVVRGERVRAFKEVVATHAAVRNVTASSVIPGRGILRGLVVTTGTRGNPTHVASIERAEVDEGFLDAYEMEVLAGRVFSPERADSNVVVLNASAAQQLGFESPAAAVGEDVYLFGEEQHTVLGVIADYHQESLQVAPDPMYFVLDPSVDAYFSIKIEGWSVSAAVAHVEAAFKDAFPGNPFDYYFLDDFFDAQYRVDQRFGQLFGFFAALAIMVACLGLFGLAAFMAVQRTKEIGIRKVVGATAIDIFALLTKDFVRFVIIAGCIALPIAYIALDRWLQGYAFRITLGWWLFAVPMLFVLFMALFTVSVQTVKAARANPVDALRYE